MLSVDRNIARAATLTIVLVLPLFMPAQVSGSELLLRREGLAEPNYWYCISFNITKPSAVNVVIFLHARGLRQSVHLVFYLLLCNEERFNSIKEDEKSLSQITILRDLNTGNVVNRNATLNKADEYSLAFKQTNQTMGQLPYFVEIYAQPIEQRLAFPTYLILSIIAIVIMIPSSLYWFIRKRKGTAQVDSQGCYT